MVNCCVPYCKSNSRLKDRSVSFHDFPSDQVLKKKWLINIARKDFYPIDTSPTCVCSKHFRKEDYVPNKKIRKLKEGTVPTIFKNYPANMQNILNIGCARRKRALVKKKSSPKENVSVNVQPSSSSNQVSILEKSSVIECLPSSSSTQELFSKETCVRDFVQASFPSNQVSFLNKSSVSECVPSSSSTRELISKESCNRVFVPSIIPASQAIILKKKLVSEFVNSVSLNNQEIISEILAISSNNQEPISEKNCVREDTLSSLSNQNTILEIKRVNECASSSKSNNSDTISDDEYIPSPSSSTGEVISEENCVEESAPSNIQESISEEICVDEYELPVSQNDDKSISKVVCDFECTASSKYHNKETQTVMGCLANKSEEIQRLRKQLDSKDKIISELKSKVTHLNKRIYFYKKNDWDAKFK